MVNEVVLGRKRLVVYVDSSVYFKLRRLARRKRTSLSNVVEKAVKNWLVVNEPEEYIDLR